ncbi:MAG: sulfatase-like hydrolase/transferase [Parvibaculaceae bacterium]
MPGSSRSIDVGRTPKFVFGLITTLLFLATSTACTGLVNPSINADPELADTAPSELPNIVILLADDMGWNDVGYYGSEIRTPNIDRLAEMGVVLNRFYAQPTCSPTRSALMTGKAPLRLGVVAPLSKNNRNGLPLEETILPEYLGDAGYQTALIGKWHLGGRRRPFMPTERGFDYFFGNLHGGIGYWDHVHGGGYDLQRNGKTVRTKEYITALTGREAVHRILTRDRERPFLLYVAFNAPHLPNEAPAETIETYTDIDDPDRRIHAAMVSELDRQIGAILDTLESNGLLENTLIWFMSDNGGLMPAPSDVQNRTDEELAAMIERGYGVPPSDQFLDFVKMNQRDAASDNSPLPGGKGTIREGGTRVPSLIYWKGRLEGGQSDEFVTVQDVLPTLLSAVDQAEPLPDTDGRSVLDVLNGAPSDQVPDYIVQARSSVVIRNGGARGLNLALYRYPWKLMSLADGSKRLFNVEVDPLESEDLAEDLPELVAELQAALDQFPRGDDIADSYESILADPDLFGGMEDRAPWAERLED